MIRNDLISMTDQDLESYTNRGTLKRALKDLEKINIPLEAVLKEDEKGNLTLSWEEQRITLFAQSIFSDSTCTCPSTKICRHMLLLVLVYQKIHRNEKTISSPSPWDPGTITDEVLEKAFGKAAIRKGEKFFNKGVLIALNRGIKPTAHFENLGIYLRFMVPGNPKYIHSDNTGPHVESATIAAIHAFRELPEDKTAGYFSNIPSLSPLPHEVQQRISTLFYAIITSGIAYAPHLEKRLRQLTSQLEKHLLFYPAAHLKQITDEIKRYHKGDARFDAKNMVREMGAVLLRTQALQKTSLPTPEILIRGAKTGTQKSIEKTRYVGLGFRMTVNEANGKVEAFFQSTDTGNTVVLERNWEERDADEPVPFDVIANKIFFNRYPISHMAKGQIISGATRKSHTQVAFTRNAALSPQSFNWKDLQPPLRIEDFKELEDHLGCQPISSFRSLKNHENFYVVTVKRVENGKFDVKSQCVMADLMDDNDHIITLQFPFSQRCKEGLKALLSLVSRHPESIRFVAGHILKTPQAVFITPISLVYVSGNTHQLLQPFVDKAHGLSQPQDISNHQTNESLLTKTAIQSVMTDLENMLSELIITGTSHQKEEKHCGWFGLTQYSRECGLNTLSDLLHHSMKIFNSDLKDEIPLKNCLKLYSYLRLSTDLTGAK